MNRIDGLIITGGLEVRFQGQEQVLNELSKLQKCITENDGIKLAISFGRLKELSKNSEIDASEHFDALHEFISEFEKILQSDQEDQEDQQAIEAKLNITLDELKYSSRLSTRTHTFLVRAGKKTVRDLVAMYEEEYEKIKHIGPQSIKEVKKLLKELGFELKVEDEKA